MLNANLFDVNSPFQEGELVMTALQSALDQFFKSKGKKQKDSMLKGLWNKKPDVESQVEQRIKQNNPQSLNDVKNLVLEMADEWKSNHGKVCKVNHEFCEAEVE